MKILQGTAAAPGLAIGSARAIRPLPSIDITAQRTVDTSVEMARLAHAITGAIARIESLRGAASGATADILAAQQEMLDDPELKQGAADLIAAGYTAEAAITRVASDYAAQLSALPDAYLAARADDVLEVGRRIVAELRGIRLSLDRPEEVFLPQLRALLRAAALYDLRIMLPMVTVPQEVEQTRLLIDGALKDLDRAGKSARRAPLGIMVETPAAVLPLLVGLGVRELSVAPARVPKVKQVLSTMTLAEMQAQAQQALGR